MYEDWTDDNVIESIEEMQALNEYSYQVNMGSGNGNDAIYQIFYQGLFTDTPLWELFDNYKKNGIEISFHFGSEDWIDIFYGDTKGRDLLKWQGEKVYI